MVTVGVTVIVPPMPSNAPVVHEPEYHFQLPPVPRLPPIIESTEEFPGHTDDGPDDAEVADVETVLSSTFAVKHDVLPQVPSALT